MLRDYIYTYVVDIYINMLVHRSEENPQRTRDDIKKFYSAVNPFREAGFQMTAL